MKIEIDTLNDSVDELKKTVTLIQEAIERRTGITGEGVRSSLRPSEFKRPSPKIIFEDIMEIKPPKKTTPVNSRIKEEPVKKRKVLKQDEHVQDEEEEDEDRKLPQIQYRDYW